MLTDICFSTMGFAGVQLKIHEGKLVFQFTTLMVRYTCGLSLLLGSKVPGQVNKGEA